MATIGERNPPSRKVDFVISEEFQNKLPPLTDEEFKHLEEIILEDGKVKDALIVWGNVDPKVLVDGHNRWKIIRSHPEIPYEVEERIFQDKWAAFDWMYKNQLGRRNLNDTDREMLIGLLYKARKHSHGGDRKSSSQIGNMNDEPARVSEQLAKELNVAKNTVIRAEHFVDGMSDCIVAAINAGSYVAWRGIMGPKNVDIKERRF